ncbi:phenylacetate--CoA ligase family protein [Rossellomorea sp. LjRoot5]|uniref:phenylacetate--CoA ligase family protein n=1 Tax=Rossellomorea sp. LjRoot5 TaxID=3342331 RepID=UPI003ECE497A
MELQAHKYSRKMVVDIDSDLTYEGLLPFFDQVEAEGRSFDALPKEEILSYQLEAVNALLEHAVNNNRYFQETFHMNGISNPALNSLEDIARLPFLHKESIRGDKSKLLCMDPKEIGQVHVTSGTTGKPIYTSFTLADQYIYELLPKYTILFPESDQDVAAVALPYEFALPGLGFQRLFQFSFGSTVLSLGKGGYMAPVDKSLELMREFGVTVLATTPSYAALLAEESVKQGIDIQRDIGLKRMILTGEGCSYEFRNRLEVLWGCEVSFFYGSTECGVIGIECKEHNGYHIAEGHVKVEIVEAEGEQVLDHGEIGELVVTTLLREGMPMIRYRTGDIGYLMKSECSCGSQMDLLQLRGRLENQLNIGGEQYSPFLLENCLLKIEGVGLWYHFVIEEDQSITIEVERSMDCTDENLKDRIEAEMNALFSTSFKVVITEIPRTFGKANRMIIRK